MKYPEHEKLAAMRDEHATLCEFLEWLSFRPAAGVAEIDEDHNVRWIPHEEIIAAYFEIDRAAFEEEKRQILDKIRE